jgi:hypothetical protein
LAFSGVLIVKTKENKKTNNADGQSRKQLKDENYENEN